MTQAQTYAAPGWYLDPDDQRRERYWNGGMWQPGGRPAGSTAVVFPTIEERPEPEGLNTATSASVAGSFEQRMLDLAAKQLVAQERTANYLAAMLALMALLLVVGIVAGLLAR